MMEKIIELILIFVTFVEIIGIGLFFLVFMSGIVLLLYRAFSESKYKNK